MKPHPGVLSVKADYLNGTLTISFDEGLTDLQSILKVCADSGYPAVNRSKPRKSKAASILVPASSLALIILTIVLARKFGHLAILPDIHSQASFGIVFLFGLMTGIHCIGMCGSFVVGINATAAGERRPLLTSNLLYGSGKVISYAFFGALFGLAGSILQITPMIAGISIALAGLFLILYGLSMLKIFTRFRLPGSRKLSFQHREWKPGGKFYAKPLTIGLLSGLILGCGPLQAMYVLAAGQGNMATGALYLAIFGAGTLPALLGFGFFARLLSNKMSKRYLQASGLLLVILGSIMLSRGLSRSIAQEGLKSAETSCCSPASNIK